MATVKKKPAVKGLPVKKAAPQPAKGRRVDWDAVERDYRTGKFTLREMGDKYGVTHSAIGQKARKSGWTADLTKAIAQATNAKLIAEIVSKEVSSATHAVSNVVLAAAEVNKRIILGHRQRLTELADAVDQAKAKLLSLGDSVADIREAATFVQAAGNLATATKTLIEQERKAYQLDDEPPDSGDKPTRIELVAL